MQSRLESAGVINPVLPSEVNSQFDVHLDADTKMNTEIFTGDEYCCWGRLFALGGEKLKDRVFAEAANNSLVSALFLTISIPAFTSGPPNNGVVVPATNLFNNLNCCYLLLWLTAILCQILSLALSIKVMTTVNKAATDKAIIDAVKSLQGFYHYNTKKGLRCCSLPMPIISADDATINIPYPNIGGTAYFSSVLSWQTSGVAVLLTGYMQYGFQETNYLLLIGIFVFTIILFTV